MAALFTDFFYQINDRILWLIMSEKSFFYRRFQNSIFEYRFRAVFLRIWESMTRQEKKSKTQHENKSSNNNFKIKKLIELKRFWICRSKCRVFLTERKVNYSLIQQERGVIRGNPDFDTQVFLRPWKHESHRSQ